MSEDNSSFLSDDDNPPVVSPDPSEQQDISNIDKCDNNLPVVENNSKLLTRPKKMSVKDTSIDEAMEIPEDGKSNENENGECKNIEVEECNEEFKVNGHINGLSEEENAANQIKNDEQGKKPSHTSVIVTNPSVDLVSNTSPIHMPTNGKINIIIICNILLQH